MTSYVVMVMFCVCFLLTAFTSKSYAICPDCSEPPQEHTTTQTDYVDAQHDETIEHLLAEFDDHEEWLLETVFKEWLLPMWQMMTEQLVTVAMQQMMIIGAFFDAKIQLETQLLLQELDTQAHKDYHPSIGMCVFGTTVRSLSNAERQAEFTTFVLSQRSIDRQMGRSGTAAATGQFRSFDSRKTLFKKTFCNIEDMAGGTVSGDKVGSLVLICNDTADPANATSGPDTQVNTDIDFTRTYDTFPTLQIDFNDTDITDDEENIFALASNLYSHNIMTRIPEAGMKDGEGRAGVLDVREIIAKRNVAEHSFNSIIGMKTLGTEETDNNSVAYMKKIIESLGITDADIQKLYTGGDLDRPSYNAQMEVLTKRIYQQPEFFTSLYDKPANVDRKRVALEAIGLMQEFDTWQSYLRTEAMLSVLLETEIMVLQEEVQNKINLL